ncbi:hypothetical protein V6N12_057253 [Hibiscus sabdariffa]|uniref:Uncharacterized protein n=1 Tax=Hibiscus sabdariffa TaxID=183260 RepID=A0ABR2DBN9_9ROSI
MGNCTVYYYTWSQASVDEANSRRSESRVRRILCRRLGRLERTGPVPRNRVAVAVRHWNEAHIGGRNGGCTVSTLTSFSLQVPAFWVTLFDRYQLWRQITGLVHGNMEAKVWGLVALGFWYYGEGSGILGSLRFRVVSGGSFTLMAGRSSHCYGFRGTGEAEVSFNMWIFKKMAKQDWLEGIKMMGERIQAQGKKEGGVKRRVLAWMMAMEFVWKLKRMAGRLKTITCVKCELIENVGGGRDTWRVSQHVQGMFVAADRDKLIPYDWIINDGLLESIQEQGLLSGDLKSNCFGLQKVIGRQKIVVWLENRIYGFLGNGIKESGPMKEKKRPRQYGKQIGYDGPWMENILRKKQSIDCMAVIMRTGPLKKWKENRKKIKDDKYVDYGNAWNKSRGLRTQRGERKFKRKWEGPRGRVTPAVRWLNSKNRRLDGGRGAVKDSNSKRQRTEGRSQGFRKRSKERSQRNRAKRGFMVEAMTKLMEDLKFSEEELAKVGYEGPFQYGEWLKVDMGQQGLVRRRPGIVYKEQRESGMGLEVVEENVKTRAGGAERICVQLERGKTVTGGTTRNRAVKRSLQGKNEVCNPFTTKRSKPCTSQGGVEDEQSEATSPNKSIPMVEAAGQPRREP